MKVGIPQFLSLLLVGVLSFLATPYFIRPEADPPAYVADPDDKCPRMQPSRLATKYLGTLHRCRQELLDVEPPRGGVA